jgi:hypothetical protein
MITDTQTYLGRPVHTRMVFNEPGTFKSFYSACGWLSANGYSYGSTTKDRKLCKYLPVAICKGEYNLPQKWHNLTREERKSVSGVMVSNNFREGEVTLIFFE